MHVGQSNIPFYYQFWDALQTALILCQFFFLHQDSLFCIYNPKTLKHWVGIQRGESYLSLASLALVSHPSSDSATIKIIYGVDAITSTSLAPHFLLLGWLKLNLRLLLDQLRLALGERSLSFFGFLRPCLSPWGYKNRCLLVALRRLIVWRPNLEVATKRLLH